MHHGQVCFKAGVGQILVEREQLTGRQHTFIYNNFGRQAAGIQHFCLAQRRVAAQLVRKALANDVQLALERLFIETIGSANEQLGDVGLRHSGGRTNVSTFSISRNFTPAKQVLAFFGDDPVDRLAAELTLFLVLGQENIAGGVLACFWQGDVELVLSNFGEERVWQCHQDAGAVAGVGFKAATTSVIHAGVEVVGVQHDLVTWATFDVCNKAYAAGIFLVGRVIQSGLLRKAKHVGVLGLISHSVRYVSLIRF